MYIYMYIYTHVFCRLLRGVSLLFIISFFEETFNPVLSCYYVS